MIPADPEDLPPQRPSVIARLVSIIEGAVAVVSGAMALFMALIVVVFIFQLAREQKVDSGLALIGLSVDDDINPGGLFQCPDVTSFPSD